MTDQDPTQRYEAPSSDQPPAPPAPEPPIAPPLMPGAAPVAPAATGPVTVIPPARNGRGWIKWAVALVVVVLVAGTAFAATRLLTGESGAADVLAWTPADSVAYVELRLDLPGDQQAELAKVMSAFPGFDDQAAFPTKLNEALDQLITRASDGKQSYREDIEPWFSGQVAVSIGPVPQTADPSAARALLLAGTKDAAKATAWAAALLQESGASSSTETYNGVTITVVTPPSGADAMGKVAAAYATFGPVLGVGDLTSVKAAIDTAGNTGLPTNAQFKTASASITGDRLGFAYVDNAALGRALQGLAGSTGTAVPTMPAFLDNLTAPWSAMALRADDGAFVIDTRQPHVDFGPSTAAESRLPALVPPGTMVLVEGHDVGKTLADLKSMLAAEPEFADAVKQLDDALALVGGSGAITDWIGEAGIAIGQDGDAVGGGLVITPTDKAAAERLFTQLRGFVGLAGAGSGITITDESYGGATITVIEVSGLGALAGGAGAPVDVPDKVQIAYAITDEVVVLAYGTDFVKGVLDARTGESLATTDRFKAAMERVAKEHASLQWIDVAGLRGLVEPLLPAGERADYDANVKPYLEPFDTMIGTGVPGTDLDRGTIVITVAGS